jgi:5-methyltetrahydropteroyltriglutamate--homocysteine methyltransferase
MNFYRADVVGSLLRPAWLKEARAARIGPQQLKWIEDRAIDEALAQQEALGLEVVTDGELRRSIFLAPLLDVVEGLGPVDEPIGAQRYWKSDQPGGPQASAPSIRDSLQAAPQAFARG